MSPEPDAEPINCNKFEAVDEEIGTTVEENPNNTKPSSQPVETCYQTDCSLARKQRERRNKSPIAITTLLETFAAPLSPASSSCTSLGNSSADATFEPSIDMMVNDFDDEQTLNEEEALAATEQQDPHEEIATLQEESEMPLEELLAKYQVAPPVPVYIATHRKRNKRHSGSGKHSKQRKIESELAVNTNILEECKDATIQGEADIDIFTKEIPTNDVILIEESGDEDHNASKFISKTVTENEELLAEHDNDCMPEQTVEIKDLSIAHTHDRPKHRRTHLMDLYPEESFAEVLTSEGGSGNDTQLDVVYNGEDEGEDVNEAEEEEEEFDSDYVKKTIMVGSSYQATIPDGLSQYGDVLPYENEDKLIWEPSQVSEREVEEYLLKARDIKPSMLDNGDEDGEECNETNIVANIAKDSTISQLNGADAESKETSTNLKRNDMQSLISLNTNESGDATAVIKDNEQALHLLVQCGYDFKEALRRKRLNALPLTGSMSLWSEEECHKFEEGIQKFGKDFLKIRQNQVRTRTMRELVQFYYLWKKSDRRDHNFANSDTVDHMDIYLNEGGDYSPTTANNGTTQTGHTINTNGAPTLGARKNSACTQKNPISIMMTGGTSTNNNSTTAPTTQLNLSGTKVTNNRKRNVVGTPSSNYENPITQSMPLSATQTK